MEKINETEDWRDKEASICKHKFSRYLHIQNQTPPFVFSIVRLDQVMVEKITKSAKIFLDRTMHNIFTSQKLYGDTDSVYVKNE
jgi:hypothetical protein